MLIEINDKCTRQGKNNGWKDVAQSVCGRVKTDFMKKKQFCILLFSFERKWMGLMKRQVNNQTLYDDLYKQS